MTLQLRLDDTDFDQLVELGRASIPGLAPGWTDHNVHDPGVMLMELAAWVADAQIYALSRMRRDERRAYAALVGVAPRLPRPATALVWPSRQAGRPHPAIGETLAKGTAVSADFPNAPGFTLARDLRLTAARLVCVATRFADGRTADFTQSNADNRASFMPFGPAPAAGDALELGFDSPLRVSGDDDAPIAIGVAAVSRETAPADANPESGPRRLSIKVEDKRGVRNVELLADTTDGLLRSGLLIVRPPVGEPGEPCRLVIRSATGGFLRAPRLLRIAPNVLPVVQLRTVGEEAPAFGTGAPDQVYLLQSGGLVDETALDVRTLEGAAVEPWRRTDDLSVLGPHDRAFTLDLAEGALRFGNGVNGMAPPAGATLQASFPVSEGARGALPAGRAWSVFGSAGVYGENLAAAAGGRDADRLDDVQGLARAKLAERMVLVTAEDLEQAARALPELGVKRAAELALSPRRPRGARVLVVAIDREDAAETVAESREWLAEIRRRLAPRLPLGQRLAVVAPRYAPVRVRTRLVVGPSIDPAAVKAAAGKALRDRLAPVPIEGRAAWPFGRDLSALSIRGWLRKLPGVVRVADVALLADGAPVERAAIAGRTLPRLELAPGDIVVEPWSPGGAS